MNKRFICILAIVSILISAFPAGSAFADGGGHAAVDGIGIKAGDYILFGKYNNKPILWQCAYKDENGKLMVSDKSICSKAFDSVGMLKGSHVHRYEHDRLLNVSNYWGDSNIRSWLNSKAPAGEVNWLCGNPPESYGNEKGFLADGNFTQEERALIKTVKQRSILDGSDVRLAAVSGGNRAIRGYSHGYFSLACDAQNIVENSYDDIYYEY